MINVSWHEKVRRRAWVIPGLAGFFMMLICCGGPPAPDGPGDRLEKAPGIEGGASGEITGQVIAFGGNPGGDIDKIEIGNNGRNGWYHFPPHLARTITRLAKVNATVLVRYREPRKEKPGRDSAAFDLIYISAVDLHQSFDLQGLPPPPPRPGELTTVGGQAAIINGVGKNRFFILGGKKIALPPRSAEILLPIISGSHHVIVKGEQRDTSDGFVSMDGLPVIRARQISIDSINYIIE